MADNRMMVEKAFVHRTQFFNVESRVIDPAVGVGIVIPVVGQMKERIEEVAIDEGPLIEVDRFKQPAIQDRKVQETGQGLAVVLGSIVPQKVEQNAEGLPEVLMVGIGFAAIDESAEATDAVMITVEVASTQQVSLLGHQEEEEPINQAEELFIEVLGIWVPIRICVKKASSEDLQAFFHSIPQSIPCPVSLFDGLLVILFQPTGVGVGCTARQARAVQKAVKQRKVGKAAITFGLEDGAQVEFHVRLPTHVSGIAEKSERQPVGHNPPQVIGAIQEFLKQGVG